MKQDKYSLEVERAIHNWYLGNGNGDPNPIFNAIKIGLENQMQFSVPIEDPEDLIKYMGNIEDIKPGQVISPQEDIHYKLRKISVGEDGMYYIPVCTNDEEVSKGGPTSQLDMDFQNVTDAAYDWKSCLGIVINPFGEELCLDKEILKAYVLDRQLKSRIVILRASVLDAHVGAIVNAANSSLLGGGGVDGAIHKAAGKRLLEKCRSLNGCATGEAKITDSYNIKTADYIIHTVGPIYSGRKQDANLLAECYYNSMDLAWKNGCSSVAFPGISTGVYGYPLDEAAEVSLGAVSKWFDDHKDTIMNVYFCCFREEEAAAYEKILGID